MKIFNYIDYLNFNTPVDAEKQQAWFEKITLSHQTLAALDTIQTPQNYLCLAEPFCPDCVVFVPILQKMAEHCKHIHVRYLPRFLIKELAYFDNAKQQKVVEETYNIPSVFALNGEKTNVIYREWPMALQEKLAANPTAREQISHAYRAGEYQKLIEEQLLRAILKKC